MTHLVGFLGNLEDTKHTHKRVVLVPKKKKEAFAEHVSQEERSRRLSDTLYEHYK